MDPRKTSGHSDARLSSHDGTVSLPPRLSEFREALELEIEAARRASQSAAVPLANGRLIGRIAEGYQYVFSVESSLSMPADAPGDLYVPGHPAPLETAVISIEGLTITLSVAEDLGSFVGTARLQSNLAQLMRKLISRIEEYAGKPNGGGDRILGVTPWSGRPTRPQLEHPTLDASQNEALEKSIGLDTTFIWGPPGTGKTRTIGRIGAELFERERSLLLVSHTNTAVDQALLQIALAENISDIDLQRGAVIRVGDPKDKRIHDKPELLLHTHVARRAEALANEMSELKELLEVLASKRIEIDRDIAICEWAGVAQPDISEMQSKLKHLQGLDSELHELETRQEELIAARDELEPFLPAAEEAANLHQRTASHESTVREHLIKLRAQEETLEELRRRLGTGTSLLNLAGSLEPLRQRRAALPATAQVQTTLADIETQVPAAMHRSGELVTALQEAETLLANTTATSALVRRWKGLPKPEDQQSVVASIGSERHAAGLALESLLTEETRQRGLLAEVRQLDTQIQLQGDIPRLEDQRVLVEELHGQITEGERSARTLRSQIAEAEQERLHLSERASAIEAGLPEESDALLRRASEMKGTASELEQQASSLRVGAASTRRDFEIGFREKVEVLREWGLADSSDGNAEELVAEVERAHARALERASTVDLPSLRVHLVQLIDEMGRVSDRIAAIEEALKAVEVLVISEADIIGTTLTRAYLRDSIQSRRFDTVLLDEASMAPIPALWIAAGLADRAVVAVGDFLQLPPIVISDAEVAQRWLGRDIFEQNGLDEAWKQGSHPDHMAMLKSQYRMHPDISAIPNSLIYRDELRDVGNPSALQPDWMDGRWPHSESVLLVDTGSAHAWVTSVNRGGRPSRLNFLSATLSVNIAALLMDPERMPLEPGDPPRVLIIGPYRPHARLVDVMLQEEGLSADAEAGTVHNFQGSEADVVILDLVNDEPHWKVGMFMQSLDESNRRLLNVAVTRARHRLIVIGDFDYVRKNSRKAFLGAEFIPYLLDRYRRLDAFEVSDLDLSAKAAAAQRRLVGGDVERTSSRLVVTQDDFYRLVLSDLAAAAARVVIYSPFMTQQRVATLQPSLMNAVANNVRVYTVTKTHSERSKRDLPSYREIEQALTDWGVTVIHKRRMHEKLVFIDDLILWSGSLNPLSFSDTQEVMERRESRDVVASYAQTLRLDDLVGAFESGHTQCPICGGEMVAAEGKDEPYYWRCVEDDCYSRSVDQPPITRGLIVCANCGGPVEFGEWGGDPSWRCLDNRHHHQRVARTHLRLPKMRALVDKKTLARLDKKFGLSG